MKYEVEVTKTETRAYKSKVTVFSDLPSGAELDDDVREKAEETAHQLDDQEWHETTDERALGSRYDTGDIEEVEDDKT